jgi:uncharacterized protein (DUF433 family)
VKVGESLACVWQASWDIITTMSAIATDYPHLSADPAGRPWVPVANVKVSEIVADYLAHGSSAEEMALQFPHLSPSMIHSALAYYYDHREELETELTESLESSRLKAIATADSPLRRRLGLTIEKP